MFRLGILQRYVVGEVVRSFALALLAITTIFVLFMVMTEATRQGLAPADIGRLVPYVIPGSLPYTIPVALLFAVSVVYGRMAGDNEVVAVKTAGQSAMAVLWPTFWLGLALGIALALMSAEVIPRANHQFKRILFRDLEDMFYKRLKKDLEFNNSNWPFFIRVNDVQDRTMIGATFKHRRDKEHPEEFDFTIRARKARIQFDTRALKARVYLEDAESIGDARASGLLLDGAQYFEYPIPEKSALKLEKKIQEKTSHELAREESAYRELMRTERARQALKAAFQIGTGRISASSIPGASYTTPGVDWVGIQQAFAEFKYWKLKCHDRETERQLRIALAFGALFFVLLGAPVGILFARRDFLSAFISCFVPIILLYYPLMLGVVNLGKQGIVNPLIVWASNALLGMLAGFFALPPVMKH